MSVGARGWVGGGARSNPHIDLYLSQIPRENIIERTDLERGMPFTPALPTPLVPEASGKSVLWAQSDENEVANWDFHFLFQFGPSIT